MQQSKKMEFINYGYSIGAILVVLGHSTPTGTSDLPLFIDDIRTFIYCFHMPLFFFIAGFLLKYTTNLNKKPYGLFIKNKMIKFLTPYIVFTLIGFIPKVLLSNFVNDEVGLNFYYFIQSFFNPRLNVWGHFWFLPTLLIIYIFSYLLLNAYKNKAVYAIVIIGAVVLALFPIQTDWFAVKDICGQLIYFCIGILLCDFIVSKRNQFFKLPIAVITSVVAIFIFVCFKNRFYIEKDAVTNLISAAIALLMLYSVFYLSVKFEKIDFKPLKHLNGKTFSIYIVSWPCQAAAEILLNRILGLHWYIVLPSMFAAGLFIPLTVVYIYGKFKCHPKFINLLLGTNIT